MPSRDFTSEDMFSSRMMSMQSSTHSSQMKTVGPAISLRTSRWLLPQNEQSNVSLGSDCTAMAPLMWLAEHEREGHHEQLIALIVDDKQDPVTPIFEAALVGEGLHDTGRVIARVSKIVHHDLELINEKLLRVGAEKIYLGHVQPPSNEMGSQRDLSVVGVLDGAVR